MKRLIALLLRATFVLHIVRFLNRKKVTILMLHGVAGDHAEAGWAPLWPRMTPERLDLVLSQLGRHYRFVSIDDAVDMIAGRKPALSNALTLTFDDGYRNNLTEALPVLEKQGQHDAADRRPELHAGGCPGARVVLAMGARQRRRSGRAEPRR